MPIQATSTSCRMRSGIHARPRRREFERPAPVRRAFESALRHESGLVNNSDKRRCSAPASSRAKQPARRRHGFVSSRARDRADTTPSGGAPCGCSSCCGSPRGLMPLETPRRGQRHLPRLSMNSTRRRPRSPSAPTARPCAERGRTAGIAAVQHRCCRFPRCRRHCLVETSVTFARGRAVEYCPSPRLSGRLPRAVQSL